MSRVPGRNAFRRVEITPDAYPTLTSTDWHIVAHLDGIISI